MSAKASSTGRLRRGWDYYRRYTERRTGVHAAAAAALTGFGLLATIHRGFIVVAIVSYLLPPAYLYLSGDDLDGDDLDGDDRRSRTPARTRTDRNARRSAVGAADTDTDGIDGDTDGVDGDTDGIDGDSDGVDGDTDTDGIDRDTDGTDADSDGGDGDTDTDSDGVDTDSDTDG